MSLAAQANAPVLYHFHGTTVITLGVAISSTNLEALFQAKEENSFLTLIAYILYSVRLIVQVFSKDWMKKLIKNP